MIDVKFPDDSILEEFRRLGEVALANFFDRHRQELHRLVRLRLDRRISRRVDTSDILQEAYFESCSRLEAYLRSPQIPPMAWIRRLARQVIARVQREHMETQKRDVRREMNGGELSRASLYDLSDAITPPIAKAARKELQQKIMALVAEMSSLDREILVLIHVENKTVREASQELDIPLETGKKRYRRALMKLKQLAKTLDEHTK